MFLLIENAGEAYTESFTTLGLSTSRNDNSKIGQFGSGAKMAILQLIRSKANPIIFSGLKKMEFFAEPAMMGNKLYNKVVLKIDNKERELGFALEYGEMDWNDCWMSLREFLSNAIDASSFDDVEVSIKDSVRAKSGATRVFIPLTPEVMTAFNLLNERFLHFSYQQNNFLIKKEKISPCKVYRRGVFVRELRTDSYYDYNLDIPVDECRNADEWSCQYYIKQSLCKLTKEDWIPILNIANLFSIKIIESEVSSSDTLDKAYLECFGDIPATSPMMLSMVQHKSSRWQVLPSNLVDILSKCGIHTHQNFLSKLEKDGNTIVEATPSIRKTYEDCRQFLMDLGYIFKEPKLAGFQSTSNNNEILIGYVENDTIYINIENESSRSTMLEELVHYMTGAHDCTRDFQTTLCDIAARSMDYFV